MDAVKICQACGKGNIAQQTECYFCHWKKFSKTYYAEALKPEAVKSKSNDGLNALPPNTAELLLALHGEFYGRGLANADAFRILPGVVKKLRLHGEIE